MQSILTVTVPATSGDLTDLATVKAELKITDNSQDTNLARWISEASAIASSYCRRVFGLETVTESFRPDRGSYGWVRSSSFLILSRKPVTAIASVTVDGVALITTDYDLDAEAGHLFRNDVSGYSSSWCWSKSINVDYTAGYSSATVPPDVERAVILIVGEMQSKDPTRDQNLKSKTTEGVSSYQWWVPGEAKTMLPIDISGLLDPYVERSVC